VGWGKSGAAGEMVAMWLALSCITAGSAGVQLRRLYWRATLEAVAGSQWAGVITGNVGGMAGWARIGAGMTARGAGVCGRRRKQLGACVWQLDWTPLEVVHLAQVGLWQRWQLVPVGPRFVVVPEGQLGYLVLDVGVQQ
jgi:hypothetical protein